MSETQSKYLQDVLQYLGYIEQFTSEGREVFLQDKKTQLAVIRAYEVIGEIVKRLPDEVLITEPQVNWQTLRRFRDFLAHRYDAVVLENIWSAVEDLSNLRAAVEAMLARADEDLDQDE